MSCFLLLFKGVLGWSVFNTQPAQVMAPVFSIVIDKIAHFNFQHPQGQVEIFIQKLKASYCFPIASRNQSLWEQFCVLRNARKKCVLKDFSNITEEH